MESTHGGTILATPDEIIDLLDQTIAYWEEEDPDSLTPHQSALLDRQIRIRAALLDGQDVPAT